MSLLKTQKIREMPDTEREERLVELRNELMHQRGIAAMGGAPPNPGSIRALRTAIARILTVKREEK